MKTYKSFKMIARIRDAIDCYMTDLWTDCYKKSLALELTKFYLKNWTVGLTNQEWIKAKEIQEFFDQDTKEDLL